MFWFSKVEIALCNLTGTDSVTFLILRYSDENRSSVIFVCD